MNWSKEHLEARMLDALEGRLSDDQLIQLQQLLQENPEFGELEDSMIFVHPDESIEMDHSVLLKKDFFNPSAFLTEEGSDKEKMAIARMEGLLTTQEKKDFEHLLKVDQELKQQWELVRQTKLIPNAKIHFPSIQTLIKDKGRVILFRQYFSYVAAACIIFLLFLKWPSQGSQAKTASRTVQKPMKIDHKETKSVVVARKTSMDNITNQFKNRVVEHVNPRPNDMLDGIVQELVPEVEQIPSTQSNYLTQPIVDPIEYAAVNPRTEPINTGNSVKSNDPIGIREYVIQKGNERFFGTANPSVSDRYSSIANYMAKSTNIPINYEQRSTEKEEITYVRLGFISIERKRIKK